MVERCLEICRGLSNRSPDGEFELSDACKDAGVTKVDLAGMLAKSKEFEKVRHKHVYGKGSRNPIRTYYWYKSLGGAFKPVKALKLGKTSKKRRSTERSTETVERRISHEGEGSLSQALRMALEHKGISPEKLSRGRGISPTNIRRVLSGKHDFKISTANNIAEGLGVRISFKIEM